MSGGSYRLRFAPKKTDCKASSAQDVGWMGFITKHTDCSALLARDMLLGQNDDAEGRPHIVHTTEK